MPPAPSTLTDRLRHSTPWRWLTRALHGTPSQAAANLPACGLGLDALPHGLGRLPTGTPVALAWLTRTADLLWAQALLHDMLQHGPVFLLAENALSVDPLLQPSALAQACAQGRLRVWLMAPGLAPFHSAAGMQALWDEMEQAGLTPQHALLVLASPRLHLGASVAQVQAWGRQVGRWCRGRTRPVVFAFQAWDSAEQVTKPLHSLPTVFQHVALLGSHAMRPLLFVDRWNGSEGALFEARFGLQVDPASQRLVYDGSQTALGAGQAVRLVEAPDQYSVIATQAALAGQRGVPPAWQVVAQLTDVLPAARHAIAATVLLHSGTANQQEDLLRLVYQLRSQHGRALKIVVHETQDKLRSNLEQALLCLGANAVVYREVGFARLQRQLDELRDATFEPELPADYALARAGFMPDAVRGYLPSVAFCDSVEAMLARTSRFGLQHSFLRLSMQPHVAHLDAIQSCLALRDGDVLSADQDALYVFMFACSETDIDAALARLFSIPPSELFAAQTLYASVDGMRTALRTLREAARQGVPDYSGYRSAHAAPDGLGGKQGAGMPGAATTPSHAASHAPAPAAAPAAAPLQDLLEHDLPTHTARTATGAAPTVHARPLARRVPDPTQGTHHAA